MCPGDCSGSRRGLWDADNLYLLVDITDANLVQDSDSGWDDDRLELFIDADNGKTPGRDSWNDYQYNFSWIPENVPPIEWYEKDTGRSLVGVDSAVVLTDGGYRIEILLPWSTMLSASPASLDPIGLALSIVDDDDPGTRCQCH